MTLRVICFLIQIHHCVTHRRFSSRFSFFVFYLLIWSSIVLIFIAKPVSQFRLYMSIYAASIDNCIWKWQSTKPVATYHGVSTGQVIRNNFCFVVLVEYYFFVTNNFHSAHNAGICVQYFFSFRNDRNNPWSASIFNISLSPFYTNRASNLSWWIPTRHQLGQHFESTSNVAVVGNYTRSVLVWFGRCWTPSIQCSHSIKRLAIAFERILFVASQASLSLDQAPNPSIR